jgi:hypothetical protein
MRPIADRVGPGPVLLAAAIVFPRRHAGEPPSTASRRRQVPQREAPARASSTGSALPAAARAAPT